MSPSPDPAAPRSAGGPPADGLPVGGPSAVARGAERPLPAGHLIGSPLRPPRDPIAPRSGRLRRFSRGERWVHGTLAVLVGVLLATAAALYVGPISQLVGRRALLAQVHTYAGYLLPLPLLLGWLRSAAFRLDTRVLNRFSPHDGEWLRARDRRSGRLPVGKFNAGQKLNGAFTVGALGVLLGTGLVLAFPDAFALSLRTGATFVHDWFALATAVVVAGHLGFALRDPGAMAGIRTGWVSTSWARREHGAWAAEQEAAEPAAGARDGGAVEGGAVEAGAVDGPGRTGEVTDPSAR